MIAVCLLALVYSPVGESQARVDEADTREKYDLVIRNGRVMDPESGLNAVRQVGIRGETIAAVSSDPLSGKVVLDAAGLIVAPGFIDVVLEMPEAYAAFQLLDGVTTALDLWVGTADVDAWYAGREGKSVTNFGVSVGHERIRRELMNDPGPVGSPGDAMNRGATEGEIVEIRRRIERGLRRGALAVSVTNTTPAASGWEMLEAFRAAANAGAVVWGPPRETGDWGVDDMPRYLTELIGAAAVTGARLCIVHILASGGPHTPRLLHMVEEARAQGLDVTADVFPYSANLSQINFWNTDDWQSWPDEWFHDLEWMATGERLTRESYAQYRESDGYVIVHNEHIEPFVTEAVASPLTLVVSGAFLDEQGHGHPRSLGAHARVLGHYGRELRALSLMDGLRKMSLMPAQLLEHRVPEMKNKGRIREGADADIVAFDADQIIDRSTFREPTRPSKGVRYVLVNGVLAVDDGVIQENLFAGRAVRTPRFGISMASGSVAIRDVTVIDVTDGSLAADQTVLIDGRRIVTVGPAGEARIPGGAKVVDAAGSYLIPGLWDMHVHSVANVALDAPIESVAARDWHFPLFLAFGVTSIRDMNDGTGDPTLKLTNSVKRRLEDGSLPGPRFLTAGPSVDGDPHLGTNSVVVRTVAEGRALVDELADAGADFVKPYENLSREAYFAIIDQARRRGLPVAGHIPFRVTPEEAADAGQRTAEHLLAMAAGCSTETESESERFARVLSGYDSLPDMERALALFRHERALYESRDALACKSTIQAYLRSGMAEAPSLIGYHAVVNAQQVLSDEKQMAFVPPVIRQNWEAQFTSEGGRTVQSILRPIVPLQAENARLLNEAGVTLLAATDVGIPMLVPGLSLHQELVLLVETAGLTPLEALQAATLNPARVLGMIDSLGTVEAGKLADLVLLDANPLEDIANTRRIRAVVSDGRLYRRADLERLLAGVNHLGMQADSSEEVESLKQLADAASGGSTFDEGRAACCYANSDKHWLVDPQGIAWEHFFTMSDAETYGEDAARTGEAGCCIPLHAAGTDPARELANCCVPNAAPEAGAPCCG